MEEEGRWVLAGTVSGLAIFFHHCSESFAGGFGGTACATSGTIGLAVEVIILSISYVLGDFSPNL